MPKPFRMTDLLPKIKDIVDRYSLPDGHAASPGG